MNAFDEIKLAVPELSPAERQQLYELLREPVELAPGISSTSGVCGRSPERLDLCGVQPRGN
jgi:hypothetical protein